MLCVRARRRRTAGGESSRGPSVSEKKKSGYDANSITVLEGLEAVRKRPGMYIGSTGERGLHHMVWEVVDNAVDEALAGYCDTVEVTLLDDGGVRVVDNGRGIPVGMHPVEKRPAVEVVLTVLHAGGKFDGKSYAVSGGLHGVGVSVVNALSHRLEVEIKTDGYVWYQPYANTQPAAKLERRNATSEHGTAITFWADPTIFETTVYNLETIRRRMQEMAFLNRGLTLVLRDERDPDGDRGDKPREYNYQYKGGIADYVRFLNEKNTPIHKSVIEFAGEGPNLSVEVAMQWNESYRESIHSFANTINTHEGGTHDEGFRTSLTSIVNRYAKEKKLLRGNDDNLTGDDIREGLAAIISVKIADPQFEGQTKTKLGNTEVKSFVQKICNEWLNDWFERNPSEARAIITKASAASRARIAAQQARKLARRKSALDSNAMPGKLSDCQSSDPRECELYIVEGDSAGGSAKQGRDPRFQAILPIRGKILNVEKARIDRVLKNNEVQSLITALGTGIHDEFDIEKLRYHKIVLMADADVDGQHIRTLLLTLLFRFMKPLVELGHVYLAQPPLYKVKWNKKGDDAQYAFSDRERDGLIRLRQEKNPKAKPDDIQRFKGLGEMNYPELWETTMNPATRTLLQVTLDDAATADNLFSVLMGEDVEARRSFIQQNAKDVRFLDI
ncbi:DNA topoisomerase (ATP-hydrolyzing) subunit B [Cryptosporangium sp. NPDC051539]|uniref:DNA topoisomerase (ATP-hydrolyzing) subunit B n=1 Tax=Cryptosporangium sp. NPDC051539 TaxID=3363962 RepID=UPI0037B04DA8